MHYIDFLKLNNACLLQLNIQNHFQQSTYLISLFSRNRKVYAVCAISVHKAASRKHQFVNGEKSLSPQVRTTKTFIFPCFKTDDPLSSRFQHMVWVTYKKKLNCRPKSPRLPRNMTPASTTLTIQVRR